MKHFGIETLANCIFCLVEPHIDGQVQRLAQNHGTTGTSQSQGRAAKSRYQQGGSEECISKFHCNFYKSFFDAVTPYH